MTRLIIAALLCVCTGSVIAQQKPKPAKDTLVVITTDTLKKEKRNRIVIEFGKRVKDSTDIKADSVEKEFKPSSKFSAQFTLARVDIGLSTYTDNGSFTLSPANSYLEHETWKSSNFGFEVFQMGYRFNSYFKIYLAAGLDWNHIRLKENITFQKKQPTLTYIPEDVEFKKNRLSSQYLRVPLSFQLRSGDDQKGNKVNFVFGPEVGFLLNGKVKQVSNARGKEKFKDDYNFNPLRYGAYARLGYGGMGVYAKYYFNDVFAEGQGPADFKNLSFGLMFGF
jgi:opacity protein-like surface antigen